MGVRTAQEVLAEFEGQEIKPDTASGVNKILDDMKQFMVENPEFATAESDSPAEDGIPELEDRKIYQTLPNWMQAGVEGTTAGLAYRAIGGKSGVQPDYKPTTLETIGSSMLSIGIDTPLYFLTFGLGGMVGKSMSGMAVSRLAQAGIRKGLTVGGGLTGAYLVHQPLRKAAEGEPLNLEEYLKGASQSYLTGVSVGVGGTLGAAGGKIAEAGVEIGAFANVPATLEKRSPTVNDYAQAAGTIVGLKGVSYLVGQALFKLSKSEPITEEEVKLVAEIVPEQRATIAMEADKIRYEGEIKQAIVESETKPTVPEKPPIAEAPAEPVQEPAKPVEATVPRAEAKPPVAETAGKAVVKPEAKIEEPKIVDAPTEPDPNTLALKKEEIITIRDGFGLNELPEFEQRKWFDVLGEAKRTGLDNQAETIAVEVKNNPRSLSDTEHAAMVLKATQLTDQYDVKLTEMDDLMKQGKMVEAEQVMKQSDAILEQLDLLTEASDMAGRESARALSIRRMRLNKQVYSLATIMRQAKVFKGANLSEVEHTKFVELGRKIQDAEAQLKQIEIRADELETKLAEANAKKALDAEKVAIKLSKKHESLQSERTEIKEALKKLGYRVNDITGLTGEGAFLVGKLAVNHIKEGALTLDEVVRKVKDDVPELTDYDVYTALNSRQQKARMVDETTKRIRQIKSEANYLKQIEDATERGVFNVSAKPPIPPERIVKLRTELETLKEINKLEDKLEKAREDKFDKPQTPKLPDPRVKILRDEINSLKAQHSKEQRVKDRIILLEKRLQDAEKGIFPEPKDRVERNADVVRLEKQIRELQTKSKLEKQIEEAKVGRFAPKRLISPSSPEIAKLRSTLRNLRNEAFRSEYDQKRLEKIMKTIAEVEDHLRKGSRPEGRQHIIEPVEIQNAKTKLQDLRSLMNAQDKLADLENQLKTGEFKVRPAISKKQVLPELEKARIQVRKAQQKVRDELEAIRPRTTREKIGEIITAPRAIMATADMSYAMRQGIILSARRPALAAKAFAKAFKAYFSQNTAEEIDAAMHLHPNQYIRDKSKLYLSPLGSRSLNRKEEVFTSNMVRKIPGFGKAAQAAERNMIVGLNMLRTGVFDEFIAKYPNATDAELKVWADYVNVASGRGDLGKFSGAAIEMSTVLFSPRFMVSRFQTPAKLAQYWKQPRVRKEIAKDLGAFVGLGMTALGLAALAGAKVGIDPRDSDFGKIVIGNTRIDIWGGELQPARLVARLGLTATDRVGLTGKYIPSYSKDISPLELAGQYATFKLSPTVTIPVELVSGKNVIGQKTTPPETLLRGLTPLFLQEVYDTYRLDSGLKALGVGGLGFVGVGAGTYKKAYKYSRTVKVREIKNMREASRLGLAEKARLDWNREHPDLLIKYDDVKR